MSRTNIVFRFLLFPLGVALLVAASLIQEGTALSPALQATSSVTGATITPSATLSVFERLAEPTLPAMPVQADYGAQTYWLLCLPCHGDRGQGLTDEFRETYPPEEQYCWESGCHGERPYEFGFTLPMQIPAVIGPNAALGKFSTAARLNAYIMAAMPYWNPGTLTEEEGWLVTSFILRENGFPLNETLDASNAEEILFAPPALSPTPEQDVQPRSVRSVNRRTSSLGMEWLLVFVVVAIIAVTAVALRRRSHE